MPMGTAPTAIVPDKPLLSQPQRILSMFFEPTKTFTDLRRGTAWWLAWLLIAIVSYGMVAAVATKIGWEQVNENQMKMNPKQAERMEKMDPAQRAQAERIGMMFTKGISYAIPLVSLVVMIVIALVLWLTFNFGFGADLTFGRTLAVVVYSQVVGIVKALLVIITLLAGANPENFTFQNPLASNLGFFVDMNEHRVLYSFASSLDVFTIWILVLAGIGISCVSRVKRGTAWGVVFGWWLFLTLVGVGFAAMMS
jgi:hypothetical protein